MGSYPDLCAKLLFMPIRDGNFGEKDSLTSCAPTNSPTPKWKSKHPMIFVFDNLWSMGTCIKLVITKSTNFSNIWKGWRIEIQRNN